MDNMLLLYMLPVIAILALGVNDLILRLLWRRDMCNLVVTEQPQIVTKEQEVSKKPTVEVEPYVPQQQVKQQQYTEQEEPQEQELEPYVVRPEPIRYIERPMPEMQQRRILQRKPIPEPEDDMEEGYVPEEADESEGYDGYEDEVEEQPREIVQTKPKRGRLIQKQTAQADELMIGCPFCKIMVGSKDILKAHIENVHIRTRKKP